MGLSDRKAKNMVLLNRVRKRFTYIKLYRRAIIPENYEKGMMDVNEYYGEIKNIEKCSNYYFSLF